MINSILTRFLRLPYFRGKTRMDQMVARALWRPQPSEVLYGLAMELDLRDWAQMQLIKQNWMEEQTIQLYEKLLGDGDVFVDVGANVGFHSLVARHLVGGTGCVLAVEPQPYNANKILCNWRANGFTNVKLYVAAAGAVEGGVDLHDQVASDRSVLTLLPAGGKNEAQVFHVPVVRLDMVLAKEGIGWVKLLKVDVEGYEWQVVQGLGQQLRKIGNIIFEYLDVPERAETNKALVELLLENDFVLRTVSGNAWAPGEAIPESNLWGAQQAKA